jgi:hypothetical protein
MQIRMQGQQPDKLQGQKKKRKWPTWVRVVSFVLALLLIIIGAVIWILNSLGSLTILLSTIFAAIGVVLGFLQLVPLFFPAKQPDISTPPIFINIPPSQMPMEGDKSTFRGIQAMPPPTDPETILPRKKDVQEVHTRLTRQVPLPLF